MNAPDNLITMRYLQCCYLTYDIENNEKRRKKKAKKYPGKPSLHWSRLRNYTCLTYWYKGKFSISYLMKFLAMWLSAIGCKYSPVLNCRCMLCVIDNIQQKMHSLPYCRANASAMHNSLSWKKQEREVEKRRAVYRKKWRCISHVPTLLKA